MVLLVDRAYISSAEPIKGISGTIAGLGGKQYKAPFSDNQARLLPESNTLWNNDDDDEDE